MERRDFVKVTRIEVIDSQGRGYVNISASCVEIQIQDDGRTLKVFTKGIDRGNPRNSNV